MAGFKLQWLILNYNGVAQARQSSKNKKKYLKKNEEKENLICG